MNEGINEDEVLSDSQSASTTRPSSSTSTDMPKSNLRSRASGADPSDGILKRQSSTIDINDLPSSLNKQSKQQTPIKVLLINGKCSKIFKSTLEDCVEECILEFPGENSIYVSKSGQTLQIPAGSNRNSITALREQSANANQSAKASRRRSSINQHNSLPQVGNARPSLTTNFSLPATATAATAASRMRHQLVQQKFSIDDNISEETNFEQSPATVIIEPEERPSDLPDEPVSPSPNPNIISSSLPSFLHHSIPSAKAHMSYRDRQKAYRLSDLVMLGPEYYAHVFNLPRYMNPSQSRERSNNRKQRVNKTAEKYSELDRIKQDLFHRYLWTQKPQVSCRIRPLSTYTRSATFMI